MLEVIVIAYKYTLLFQIMKIQLFFLLCLSAIISIQAWKKLLPNYEFVNTNCLVGQTKGENKQKVVDCIGCSTFPIQVSQRGQIQILNGNIEQLKQHNTNGRSQFHLILYMQQQCTQYQCTDFQSAQTFVDKKILQKAGLHPVKQIQKAVSDDLWQFSIGYDNRLSQDKHTNSVRNRFVNYILSPILPYSLLPAKQYYSSFVAKIRYTQSLNKNNEQIIKPIIKISIITESVSDFLVISILIFFTLAIKRHIFNSKNQIDFPTLVLSLGFLSPYLFSIFSFVLLSMKTPHHIIALFLFVAGLCLDMQILVLCGVTMSSMIQMMKGSKIMSIQQIALFNLLIVIATIFNIDSVLSSAPTLLCALSQQLTLDYSQIQQKQKNRTPIQLQKHQENTLQDH